MSGSFKQSINFPSTYEYSSDSENIPLEFYEEAFPISKTIDLLLGYFSTNAIKVLSMSLAEFIYNGGSLRLVTNHFFSNSDYDFITESGNKVDDEIIDIFSDLQELQKNLSPEGKHFFDCLLYLKNQGRLDIKPVKFRGDSMSHSKIMILNDGTDTITTAGSINFTLSALLKNAEHFQVEVPWNGALSQMRISENVKKFNYIFNDTHPDYRHIGSDELIKVINTIGQPKELNELLDDSFNLTCNDEISQKITRIRNKRKIRFEEVLEKIRSTPRFPKSGTPREYQLEAYQNWVNNDFRGIFAMATGTGKTITSLNCILQDYQKNNYYKFIVLVPTIPLANQWQVETVEKFNFRKTVVCSSKNSEWENELKGIAKKIKFNENPNYCIILTYATFKSKKFQELIKSYFESDFDKMTLIADECHAMGSAGLLSKLPHYIAKRIGLSATPSRQFDEDGDKAISEFFDGFPPKYTYRYDMKKAIETEVLCSYFYHPRFVELEQDELSEYIKISEKLIKFFDSETGKYKDDPIVTNLLIRRKNIIHKARQKLVCLKEIVEEIGVENFKNAFVYVPEGIDYDYENFDYFDPNQDEISTNLITKYSKELYERFKIRLRTFTGNTKDREEIIIQFKNQKLDALLAMKCLDEGIDIPQTQLAIFCASTGNPRQYIQRRGRVLRRYDGKEHAIIYDMIVKPSFDPTFTDEKIIGFEKNIFKSELKRIINFAVLARNQDVILEELEQLANYCGEDIYELAKKEYENFE